MNYYKVLEVDKDASDEVIKKAYWVLSKKFHPDSRDDHSEIYYQRMRLINEAYEVLSDTKKREAYNGQTQLWRLWINDGLIGVAKVWLRTF